ncbi:unnamed protein product [Coregonus sp. 'balchen']|nr:unnamed protein product [Coregonus sp. 'balchen']
MAAPSTVGGIAEKNSTETGQILPKSTCGELKTTQFGTRFLTDPQDFDCRANEYWNKFYTIHENRFFKDRHWLFTEFPELAPQCRLNLESCIGDHRAEDSEPHGLDQSQGQSSEVTPLAPGDGDFPGSSAIDPGLFVYCCDFSSTAVELVKANSEYDPGRCYAFVHDLGDEGAIYPVPDASLDVIVLIFVLSALHPDKCLSDNFYVRGDGTQVYFFTQDELHDYFSEAGLEKVQNMVDRRLQVNRGKQLTMYRVWIQCKYRKPHTQPTETQD